MKINRVSERTFTEYKKKAILKIESILDALDIPYIIKSQYMINILCPVHGSTDYSSSSIRLADGMWTCWSRSCNQEVGRNFIHLIKWSLSQKQNTIWQDVIDFIDNPTFQSIERKINPIIEEEHEFDIRTYPTIVIPSKYYLNRNFSTTTLKKFNIGDCYSGKYANKAIVPVSNNQNKIIGFSARSIYEKCNKCNYHHSQFEMCISPSNRYANNYKKWIHSYGLKTSSHLYNIENVKTDKVAIIEGPSCVWRLDDFNITGLACLGKEFSSKHKNLLKKCGVTKILFISDNDEAGNLFRHKFVKENMNDFQLYFPKAMTNKDVSDMQIEDIENNILSVWEKI